MVANFDTLFSKMAYIGLGIEFLLMTSRHFGLLKYAIAHYKYIKQIFRVKTRVWFLFVVLIFLQVYVSLLRMYLDPQVLDDVEIQTNIPAALNVLQEHRNKISTAKVTISPHRSPLPGASICTVSVSQPMPRLSYF